MKKKTDRKRARTARRSEARAIAKLSRARERLFELEPGGSPERPIDIASPAVVEPRAAGMRCPVCELPFRVEAHRAPSSEGMRLREAVVTCARCGRRRSLWFRLTGDTLN